MPTVLRTPRPALGSLLAALLLAGGSRADEPAPGPAVRTAKRTRPRYTDGRLPPRDPPRQPGGFDVWGDERFFYDWHIQRNAVSGHCRLLDGRGERESWGTFDECLQRLEAIRRERRLPPMRGKAVVVLHGLDGSPETMRPLAAYLRAAGGTHVLNLAYPSRRGEIADHARAFANVADHLDEVDELHVVAFGLANVVVRRWLADRTKGDGNAPQRPALGRVVMIAPPNQSSGSTSGDIEMLVNVLGLSARHLDGGWEAIESRLAAPPGDFGIVAGGRGDDRGFSTRLSGDDDGTLSVAATRLAGARDTLLLPIAHAQLASDRRVLDATLTFLRHGSFRPADNATIEPKR